MEKVSSPTRTKSQILQEILKDKTFLSRIQSSPELDDKLDHHPDIDHRVEFQLNNPPNSPDLNPMEHIWDVMERQLRAQTPPCPNISTLRDRCLDIWYNLSPVMYQKLVASITRRVAAVLKAKGGTKRY
ncbi:hypothetical protein AVEN_4491-1 [Araneus ventricosus]|uniref:Uncharacterized protein n=1 Tax=Araneus ventricosus TaxID=182803 RepID=A0A4Y2BND8_ARAVE|nr:hypothetical protein AVEN_4491-1 [Araneus ventricosus]